MNVINSPLLALHDRCFRAGWRALRQSPGPECALDVMRDAVDHGLGLPSSRSEMASAYVRRAALYNGLEVEPGQNIFHISEHISAIAEQIVYVVGGEKPWVRPDTVLLDESHAWESRAWLGRGGLRRVVLTDRWRERTEMTWRDAGEQAVYGGVLTEITVILGNHHDGRFHGHWSKGWKHPRNGEVRIQSSAGGELNKWMKIWREDEGLTAKEWATRMQPAMGAAMRVVERPELKPEQRAAWRRLALRKMEAMERGEEPDPQPSQCHRPTACLFGPCVI
jgi:hypothetical protein